MVIQYFILFEVDCEMTEWAAHGECSAPCGGGRQTFTKNVIRQGEHGGLACGNTTKIESCNIHDCPGKVSDNVFLICPMCSDCQNAETHGTDYDGITNLTENSQPCVKWSEVTTGWSDNSSEWTALPENYCR